MENVHLDILQQQKVSLLTRWRSPSFKQMSKCFEITCFRVLSDDAEEEAVVLQMEKKQSEVHGSRGVYIVYWSVISHFAASFQCQQQESPPK
jgi:hypothetical protein